MTDAVSVVPPRAASVNSKVVFWAVFCAPNAIAAFAKPVATNANVLALFVRVVTAVRAPTFVPVLALVPWLICNVSMFEICVEASVLVADVSWSSSVSVPAPPLMVSSDPKFASVPAKRSLPDVPGKLSIPVVSGSIVAF